MSRIAVFGDSIAWGSYDPLNGGWVNSLVFAGFKTLGSLRLSDDVCYSEVFNLGIGSDNVSSLIQRFDVEVSARQPDVVVIAIGINDVAHEGLPATPIDDFTTMYGSLVIKAIEAADRVLIVTPTNVDESRDEHDWTNADIARYVDVIERIADNHQVEVVNVFGLLDSSDLTPDGIHPGTEGHKKLFQKISPLIFDRQF